MKKVDQVSSDGHQMSLAGPLHWDPSRTCSNLFKLELIVHYEARTVDKRSVGILLESCLVNLR